MRPVRAILFLSFFAIVPAGALALRAVGGGEADPPNPPPPVNSVFAGVLLRVGLSAEALAAAGTTGSQVPSLVAAVESAHDPSTLASRDQAYADARVNRDRLARLVQSGLGSQADVTALVQAETDLQTATSARESYLAGLRSAGLATVAATASASVQRIHANSSWGFPVHYLVSDRSEPDWVALRDALATKRISEQYGEPFYPEAQVYLAAVDLEPEIALAKVNFDTNIVAVQTAWNSAAAD